MKDSDHYSEVSRGSVNEPLAAHSSHANLMKYSDGWKDHEFVIIADDLNDDFVDLFFDVYRVYVEELSVFCWSSGIALPSLSNVNKSNIGAVARISSRYDKFGGFKNFDTSVKEN